MKTEKPKKDESINKKNTKNHVELDTPLQFVKGVGPKLAAVLKKGSLFTVHDFINRFPRGYKDNRVLSSLADIIPNQSVIVSADVVKKNIIPLRGRNKKIYEIILGDGLHSVSCKFFKIPYRNWFNSLRVGERVELRGKAVLYRNRMEFHHPQIFPANPEEPTNETDLVLALYSEIEQISQNKIRNIMKEIFSNLKLSESDLEWLPKWLKKKYHLPSRLKALKGVHFPDTKCIDDYLNFKTESQKRLIFDEFFELQFYFALKNQGWKLGKAPKIPIDRTSPFKNGKKSALFLNLCPKKSFRSYFF